LGHSVYRAAYNNFIRETNNDRNKFSKEKTECSRVNSHLKVNELTNRATHVYTVTA